MQERGFLCSSKLNMTSMRGDTDVGLPSGDAKTLEPPLDILTLRIALRSIIRRLDVFA